MEGMHQNSVLFLKLKIDCFRKNFDSRLIEDLSSQKED